MAALSVLGADAAAPRSPEQDVTLRCVTMIVGVVIAPTFLFGFGNVLDLALRLGVPAFIAPLVAPAVDLSVMGLLVATRFLAVRGASHAQLRPARRLLILSGAVTLALNVIDPLVAGHLGKAAFDAVGPLLLIGWVEVGPGLLRAIAAVQPPPMTAESAPEGGTEEGAVGTSPPPAVPREQLSRVPSDELLERARMVDEWHRAEYLRPVSAETFRQRLQIGAGQSRLLVATIRAELRDGRTVPDSLSERSPAVASSVG
jgi:hypothetical protein